MCGIIAYTGYRPALPILVAGMRRLEYRGYDSSGIAVHYRSKLSVFKEAGKLTQLENLLPDKVTGKSGMGHTRWATHGVANKVNAHPHLDPSGRVAVIHNGIIENASYLRETCSTSVALLSDTDTEVLAHLIAERLSLNDQTTLLEATRQVLFKVQGTFGIVVMDSRSPGELIAARRGSPVIIGCGDKEMFVTSDANAILNHTREVIHLEDGELARVQPGGVDITTMEQHNTTRSGIHLEHAQETLDKGNYKHFLHKEVYDQPESVGRTLSGRLDFQFGTARLGGLNLSARELRDIRRIKILGCGSAYYAGISGAYLIEDLTRLPCSAEPAAEFRYRNPVIEADTLYIVVSQSGETFDTLAALREISRKGGHIIGITNVVGSTISREVDGGIYMHAGPEVSVASTKAYSCMLTCFMLLALQLGRIHDLSPQQGAEIVDHLQSLPDLVATALTTEGAVQTLAGKYTGARSAFYVGRTSAWPVALEGAQKLKEISYIHAEAYPASELKHGPLALVDTETPTVVILPDNDLLVKSVSVIHEIKARSGPVIVITDAIHADIDQLSDDVIRLPESHKILQPLLLGIPLQLFAYHMAVLMGKDVDQPRNLAKSVTVE